MARKSRRQQNIVQENKILVPEVKIQKRENLLATAAYGRLSIENSGHETDDSLQTQMELLYQFIENHADLELVDSYMDNGYSGTNFDRPEFIRLMEDVKKGKIQCIVVKDLSRFGRNYLEMGYYIETLFPHLNVRFIAVTDDFDSIHEEDRNSLTVPLKNMVNDLYAKDTSKKLCVAAEARAKRSDAMPNGNPPFGYLFSEDKKQYLVDPENGKYVRMIFQWILMGISSKKIAQRLNLLGVMTPKQNLLRIAGKEVSKVEWKDYMLYRLLKNPNYTGDIHMGRIKQALYRSENRRWTAPEEWIVRKNTHEPLISREDYQRVQEILQEKSDFAVSKREFYDEEGLQDNFPNMVYCAKCGHSLHFVRYAHECTSMKKSIKVYVCRSKNGTVACGQIVYEDFLKIVVMDQIHILIKSMCDRKKLLDKVNTSRGGKNALLSAQKQMMALNAKIIETEDKQTKLYENFAGGILEQEDYQSIKEKYIYDMQKMKEELRQLEQRKRKMAKTISQYNEIVHHLERYLDRREFQPNLVKELVERITISESKGVEVTFKCNDVYEEIVKMMEGSIEE